MAVLVMPGCSNKANRFVQVEVKPSAIKRITGMNPKIGGILLMSVGIIFLAVAFIMFPNVTTACQTILDWSYTSNVTITDATFTGLTTIIGIYPLLALLGLLAAGVIGGFLGIKLIKNGETGGRFSIASFLILGIGLIFISLGLNIYPVLLDAVASVVHNGGAGISASFTGLSSLLLMAPMIVILGFMVATVVKGFFGVNISQETED